MHHVMLAMLQTPEIIGLLVLALIFFGAKKLPELARGLGSGIKEFRKATRDVTDELQSAIDSDPPPPPRRPTPTSQSLPMTSDREDLPSDSSETQPQPESAVASDSKAKLD